MIVKLHYRTVDEKEAVLVKTISMKEARELAEKLKKNSKILFVWVSWFGKWRRRYKTIWDRRKRNES